MAERARFTHDGYPANLEAAAYDALDWLQKMPQFANLNDEGRARLVRCRSALSLYLAPCLPAEFERAYHDEVAEIVTANEQEATANA